MVAGGASSGKSAFAEELIVRSGLTRRVYAATMEVCDAESVRRVERHRAMRAGKGFETVELPRLLPGVTAPEGAAVLLEDLPNLAANHCFSARPDRLDARRVLAWSRPAALTVVVTGDLFADGASYGGGMADYLRVLAGTAGGLARAADAVYEVVCGIPVCWKGDGK